eukprot:Opistho-2@30887
MGTTSFADPLPFTPLWLDSWSPECAEEITCKMSIKREAGRFNTATDDESDSDSHQPDAMNNPPARLRGAAGALGLRMPVMPVSDRAHIGAGQQFMVPDLSMLSGNRSLDASFNSGFINPTLFGFEIESALNSSATTDDAEDVLLDRSIPAQQQPMSWSDETHTFGPGSVAHQIASSGPTRGQRAGVQGNEFLVANRSFSTTATHMQISGETRHKRRRGSSDSGASLPQPGSSGSAVAKGPRSKRARTSITSQNPNESQSDGHRAAAIRAAEPHNNAESVNQASAAVQWSANERYQRQQLQFDRQQHHQPQAGEQHAHHQRQQLPFVAMQMPPHMVFPDDTPTQLAIAGTGSGEQQQAYPVYFINYLTAEQVQVLGIDVATANAMGPISVVNYANAGELNAPAAVAMGTNNNLAQWSSQVVSPVTPLSTATQYPVLSNVAPNTVSSSATLAMKASTITRKPSIHASVADHAATAPTMARRGSHDAHALGDSQITPATADGYKQDPAPDRSQNAGNIRTASLNVKGIETPISAPSQQRRPSLPDTDHSEGSIASESTTAGSMAAAGQGTMAAKSKGASRITALNDGVVVRHVWRKESDGVFMTFYNQRGQKQCANCQSTRTPQWRRGPDGEMSLCNACGLRYFKWEKKNLRESSQESGQSVLSAVSQSETTVTVTPPPPPPTEGSEATGGHAE